VEKELNGFLNKYDFVQFQEGQKDLFNCIKVVADDFKNPAEATADEEVTHCVWLSP
jgi:hypothetical protein